MSLKTLTLAGALALAPMVATAQSTQPPVNSPTNNRPTTAAPVPVPGDATVAPTPQPGVTANPAGGGVLGAPSNPPMAPSGTMPSTPPTGTAPNPAGGGSTSVPAKP
ncbi:MAG: hypothetical protein Q8S58_18830 [Bosea sp. (in: a-proteobacteria)]|uniref:hypothetical protein n=1 Tax=Bosea sp. (in: a-proteobacteria) TaxID=1871050 RepID=UPI0027355A92|nr:hypothetical protein [Bosea sp. (in: a-proteobacteria)]MDP3255447.1 hypothetical protein [Bosea sp. (in: a-proteobacteria)]MDP3321184.1 hypothetical protein [Bosea sp. (in: a-proteobacteria)]